MQPVREQFGGVITCHSAGKTQPTFAQDALVRVGTEEALHQYCEPGPLRFLPYRHFQRIVDLRQQRAPFAVGQKTVVTHHLKMPRRDMADVTLQHLPLADLLAFVLLCTVIVILMDHGAAALIPELGSRHWRTFQVSAQVFHAAPGAAGLFGEVHFPGTAILGMQIAVPPVLVTDMAETRQGAGIDLRIVVAQQVNHGVAPDGFHFFLFKEQMTPDAVFDIKSAAGNGNVDMWLIELSAVGMERTEDTDFDPLLARSAEHAGLCRIKESSGNMLFFGIACPCLS
jgi:hypothetical protein